MEQASECPTFQKFIKEAFGDNQEMISYFQMILGMAIFIDCLHSSTDKLCKNAGFFSFKVTKMHD